MILHTAVTKTSRSERVCGRHVFTALTKTNVTFFFLFSLSWRPDTSLVLASAVLSS